jgi:predicted ATPase
MDRGASGEPKDTETGEQRTRTDLEQASHGEGSFTVAENRFGEKEKLESYGG